MKKLIPNKLYFGDCKIILTEYAVPEYFKFIYIDPPFFSNKTYEVIWKDGAEIRSFEDRWEGGIETYINWMNERISIIREFLDNKGIFALHCDHHASHYLKIECDKIFGRNNFLVELIWRYVSGGYSKRCWSQKTDSIFLYSKTNEYQFNIDDVRVPYDKKTIERSNYKLAGKIRKINPKGKLPDNVIELPAIRQNAKERIGYPTQKPLKLLEYLLKGCSSKNDLIGDFFCGGGTTLVAAKNLGRRFIGIDVSPKACVVSCRRLKINRLNIINYPYTKERIFKLDGYQFQSWVMDKLHGIDRGKDNDGIDGYIPIYDKTTNVAVQIKNYQISRKHINHFIRSIKRSSFNKKRGVMVGLSKNGASAISRDANEEIAIARREGIIIDKIDASIWLDNRKNLDSYIEDNEFKNLDKPIKDKQYTCNTLDNFFQDQ